MFVFEAFRNFLARELVLAKDCNGSSVMFSAGAEFADPDGISENGAKFT